MSDVVKRPGSHRPQRVADQVREEIAKFLINGVKDPRIGFVTITNVKITPDLQMAKVFYTAYGSRNEQIESSNGLMESAKEIRQHIAKTLQMRYTPKLEFIVDEGIEHSYRINELLGQVIHPADAKPESSDEDDSSDDEG